MASKGDLHVVRIVCPGHDPDEWGYCRKWLRDCEGLRGIKPCSQCYGGHDGEDWRACAGCGDLIYCAHTDWLAHNGREECDLFHGPVPGDLWDLYMEKSEEARKRYEEVRKSEK